MKIRWYWFRIEKDRGYIGFEFDIGITIQNNIRFLEIGFHIGIGTLNIAFDKIGGKNE